MRIRAISIDTAKTPFAPEFWREHFLSFLFAALAVAFAATIGVIALASDKKAALAILGGFGFLLACIASGNPRLLCLWGLMLTLPLDLSKKIGPMLLGKDGGENSFRIDLCDVFMYCLAVLLLWDIFIGVRRGFRIPKLIIPWVLLIAIGFAWLLAGPSRLSAAHELFRMFKVMLLFLILVNELERPRRILHCAAALSLGALAESIIALLEYRAKGVLGLQILGETTADTVRHLKLTSLLDEQAFRASALMQHPNLLGIYLAILVPLALALLLLRTNRIYKLIFLFTVLAGIPGMVVTLSRSAWLSFSLACLLILVFLILHHGIRRRALYLTCALTVLGSITLGVFSGQILKRLFESKNDATIGREVFKEDARRMIDAAPLLGHGLNTYVIQLPRFTRVSMKSYGTWLPPVHHIFYLWWAETGVIGMMLFISLWAWVIYEALQNLRIRDQLLFTLNAACLAAMIALIPDSFLSFTLRVNSMLRVFWVLAAIIVAIRYLRLRTERESLQGHPNG